MDIKDILDAEEYSILQWRMTKDEELKVGDLVLVSGSLTGYGNLEGYITDIHDNLISVNYTSKSRIKANNEKGIVGLKHFFSLDASNIL